VPVLAVPPVLAVLAVLAADTFEGIVATGRAATRRRFLLLSIDGGRTGRTGRTGRCAWRFLLLSDEGGGPRCGVAEVAVEEGGHDGQAGNAIGGYGGGVF
jgi:hypothetical protein